MEILSKGQMSQRKNILCGKVFGQLSDRAIESLQLGPLGPAPLVLPSLSRAALDGQPGAAVPTFLG